MRTVTSCVVVFGCAWLAAANVHAAGVYKCRSEADRRRGDRVYQQLPCPHGTELRIRRSHSRRSRSFRSNSRHRRRRRSSSLRRARPRLRRNRSDARRPTRIDGPAMPRSSSAVTSGIGMSDGEVLARLGPPDLQAARARPQDALDLHARRRLIRRRSRWCDSRTARSSTSSGRRCGDDRGSRHTPVTSRSIDGRTLASVAAAGERSQCHGRQARNSRASVPGCSCSPASAPTTRRRSRLACAQDRAAARLRRRRRRHEPLGA